MKWLIVADSRAARTGHWFEYLDGFQRDLRPGGDSVRFLVSRQTEAAIIRHFDATPALPPSFFRQAGDGAGSLRRAARIPIHAWRMWRSLRSELRGESDCDVIFVPTVMAPHLLAWARLVRTRRLPPRARLLLFFPNLPLRCARVGAAEIDGSPTSKILRRVLRTLAPEVQTGRVVLGVETHAMRAAASAVFGVPFTYLPHPVHPLGAPAAADGAAGGLLFGCYGPARHEKGGDLLVQAIDRHLAAFPESRLRFAVQWVEDFPLPDGSVARVPARLREHPRVEIIPRIFRAGEYAERLAQTDALLLPYRLSSYALRVSRVVLEGLVNGKPVLATRGTTLAEQAAQYGASTLCDDGDVTSVCDGIRALELAHAAQAELARARQPLAQDHFSVATFQRLLDTPGPASPSSPP